METDITATINDWHSLLTRSGIEVVRKFDERLAFVIGLNSTNPHRVGAAVFIYFDDYITYIDYCAAAYRAGPLQTNVKIEEWEKLLNKSNIPYKKKSTTTETNSPSWLEFVLLNAVNRKKYPCSISYHNSTGQIFYMAIEENN